MLLCAASAVAAQSTSVANAAELNSEGARALQRGKVRQAETSFQAAYKADPSNPSIAFNLGLARFRLGEYQRAIEPLRAATKGHGTPQGIYLLGVSLYQTRKYSEAAEVLEHLHRESPHLDEVLYLLEESYRLGGQAAKAKDCFSELARRFPDSAFVHKLAGLAYEERGVDDLALDEFRKAAEKNATLLEVNREIGVLLLNRHQPADAALWFKRELARNPCDAPSHYYLGEIARGEEKLPEAMNFYREAIQCDPSYAEGHLGLGRILQDQGKTADAISALRDAVRLDPENVQGRYQLVRCLLALGKTQEAQAQAAEIKRVLARKDAKVAAKLAETQK